VQPLNDILLLLLLMFLLVTTAIIMVAEAVAEGTAAAADIGIPEMPITLETPTLRVGAVVILLVATVAGEASLGKTVTTLVPHGATTIEPQRF
jgi:hypothetical protein